MYKTIKVLYQPVKLEKFPESQAQKNGHIARFFILGINV